MADRDVADPYSSLFALSIMVQISIMADTISSRHVTRELGSKERERDFIIHLNPDSVCINAKEDDTDSAVLHKPRGKSGVN